eukprot:scaffold2.g7396.t1
MLRRLLLGLGEYAERVKNPWPEAQRILFRFATAEELARWEPYSDSEMGGLSTAALQLSEECPGTAEFSGRFSTALGEGVAPRLKRSGFAGFSLRPSGDAIDIEDFDSLVGGLMLNVDGVVVMLKVFRVRSDGRKYIASVRCENWLVDDRSHDVWQAFLFARKGEWEEVEVPLSRFMLTWKGRVVEEVVELNPKRITAIGISLAGGQGLQEEGEYRLGVDWIAALNHNGLQQEERGGREE